MPLLLVPFGPQLIDCIVITYTEAVAKELSLQAEAVAWSAPTVGADIPLASEDDIPTIDLARLDGMP